MICETCDRKTHSMKTVIDSGEIYVGCERCLPSQLQSGNELSAKGKREWQKGQYRKDTLQPNQRDFVKAYGRDVAKEWGFNDDQIRKLS